MKEHKLDFIHLFCYRSSGPVSFGYSELENNTQQASILSADIAAQTTPGIERAPFSIKNELKVSSIMIMKKFELTNNNRTKHFPLLLLFLSFSEPFGGGKCKQEANAR